MLTTSSRPRSALLAASGIFAVVVAACSSSGGASPAASAVTPSVAPSAAASAGEVYTVALANGASGAYITGEDGKTLYVFTNDTANTSSCVDACATNWPPFTIDADETVAAGAGVTGTLTTFARPDGSKQVAINGMPLYYFAKDTKAGDLNGQGLNGKWFAASPAGAAPSPSTSSGGYSY